MERSLKIKLILTGIIAFFSSLSLVLAPYFLGLSIDAMIGIGAVDFQDVHKYLGITALVYLTNFCLTWIVAWISNKLAVDFVFDLREKLKLKVSKLPLSAIDRTPLGKFRVLFANDGELIIEGLNHFINQALSGMFVIVISLIFMWRINIFMTIVSVLLVPVMYFTAQYITRKSLTLYRKQQNLTAQLSGFTNEVVQNNELVMSSSYQHEVLKRYDVMNQELRDVSEKAIFIAALPNPTTRVVNNIGYMLLGLTGAYAVFNFGLTVGFLTSFISYSVMFSKPFNELSAIVSQVSAAKSAYDRYQEILKLEDEIAPDKKLDFSGDTIEFEHVSFGYDSDKIILKDLNLHVKDKSKVAIVGPTGSGKSTLINLLMRYYDIDTGTLKIDGHNVVDISKESTRNVMAIVLQDPWLFEGTIKENIRYGKPSATDEEVVAAAKQAGVHEYIVSLDNGYDSLVEIGSKNISLGQRQMITIARALLIDAPIIILDEATSSLDVVTEKEIQKIFSTIMKSKTSFFIAHRLNTVIDSDVILVMKDGVLIEQGNHDELMMLKGFYYSLYISQNENENSPQ